MVGWLGSDTALPRIKSWWQCRRSTSWCTTGMGSAVSVRIQLLFGQNDLECRHTAKRIPHHSGHDCHHRYTYLPAAPLNVGPGLPTTKPSVWWWHNWLSPSCCISLVTDCKSILPMRCEYYCRRTPMMLFSFIAYFLISLPAGYLFGFVCMGNTSVSGQLFLSDLPVPESCITCDSDIKRNLSAKPCSPLLFQNRYRLHIAGGASW